MEWISVEKELPKFEVRVLTWFDSGYWAKNFLSDAYGPTEWDVKRFGKVTHWMTPKPPTD